MVCAGMDFFFNDWYRHSLYFLNLKTWQCIYCLKLFSPLLNNQFKWLVIICFHMIHVEDVQFNWRKVNCAEKSGCLEVSYCRSFNHYNFTTSLNFQFNFSYSICIDIKQPYKILCNGEELKTLYLIWCKGEFFFYILTSSIKPFGQI